jgi:alcohol dehydrogenase (cytochrome c)
VECAVGRRASESATGKTLWQIQLDLTPNAFPITFAKDGTQYVSITTGGGAPADVSWQTLTPEIQNPEGATTLWVFKLADGPCKNAIDNSTTNRGRGLLR